MLKVSEPYYVTLRHQLLSLLASLGDYGMSTQQWGRVTQQGGEGAQQCHSIQLGCSVDDCNWPLGSQRQSRWSQQCNLPSTVSSLSVSQPADWKYRLGQSHKRLDDTMDTQTNCHPIFITKFFWCWIILSKDQNLKISSDSEPLIVKSQNCSHFVWPD